MRAGPEAGVARRKGRERPALEGQRPPRTIRLTPLSSPRSGPPQGPLPPLGLPGPVTCAPKEEDAPFQSRMVTAIGGGLPPNI